MPQVLLTTLNARYWHSSFGLRYLLANMGSLRETTEICEFGIKDQTIEILGNILEKQPQIVGLGVYIWNVEPVTRLIREIRRVAPDIKLIVGGPEVSYETADQPLVEDVDHVICGEADLTFPQLCDELLSGSTTPAKIIVAPPPKFEDLQLPYDLYNEEDIANRVIYVEASRGCPFTCEFCLSALEIPVRQANLDSFLSSMQDLFDRGVRQFKFVDRTFNLNLRFSRTILEFFLDRYEPGLFLHFEMIPDRLPAELRELIARFPSGALQFEIGVQTFSDDVGERISRRQDNAKLEENFRFLRSDTGVHIHADLIVGLPGETIESFGAGFNRLISLDPQEIQIGILKRLRGTPITRHDETYRMVYSPNPPYEIMTTSEIDFSQMQRLRRFARFWDLVGNSGNFKNSRELIWHNGEAFDRFLAFSDWIYQQEGKQHGISLARLSERVFEFLIQEGLPEDEAAKCIWEDYVGGGRYDKPHFLRPFDLPDPPVRKSTISAPPRQARHIS